MTKKSKNFFGKGEKRAQKKIHLVYWKPMRDLKYCDGMGINDPTIMNIALGAKIIWRLIMREEKWWVKTLYKKYFEGERERIFDKPMVNLKGSPIWKFPKESAPIIQDKLTWILGNKKLISIWNESILGKTPLKENVRGFLTSQWVI
jgi:hypothetical protein